MCLFLDGKFTFDYPMSSVDVETGPVRFSSKSANILKPITGVNDNANYSYSHYLFVPIRKIPFTLAATLHCYPVVDGLERFDVGFAGTKISVRSDYVGYNSLIIICPATLTGAASPYAAQG